MTIKITVTLRNAEFDTMHPTMKTLLCALFFLTITVCTSQEIEDTYQRAIIHFETQEDINTLHQLGIPADHGINYQRKTLLSDFLTSEINRARNAGFLIDIIHEDSKQFYKEQNNTSQQLNALCNDSYPTPANFQLGSMGGYFTYQEVLDQLDLMHELYPNLITAPANVGDFVTEGTPDDSVTPSIGGNRIKWLKISDNPNNSGSEPQIFYNAITHAREPTSLSQLLYYMWYLLENYASDPEVKSIVDNTELYFVPVLNPDGYLYNQKTDPQGGGLWRKNRKDTDGVDVNRNYDYYINGDPENNTWGGEGTSDDPLSNIYHGTGPFSEVESQAMKWFCEQHNFLMTLNNHSSGNGIFCPYGYEVDAFTPENEVYESFLPVLTSENGYFARKTLGLSGTANDFMYGTVGTHDRIFSITPEIGNQFWLQSDEIIPACKRMMFLNLSAAKMVNGTALIKDSNPIFTGDQTSIDYEFSIQNLSLLETKIFTTSINALSSNIVDASETMEVTLDPFEEATLSIPYTLIDDPGVGNEIRFELLVDNGTFITKRRINQRFGLPEIPFTDSGNSNTDNFTSNDWGVTDATFVSPPSSITDSPDGDYQINQNKNIAINETIDLTNAAYAYVEFYARWYTTQGFDYVQFEISTDDGQSWAPQCGRYTNTSNFNTDESVYDGIQEEWVLENINLDQYLGETISARFQFISDDFGSEDGFYFDDLTFSVVDQDALSTTSIPADDFKTFPNPVDAFLNIQGGIRSYTTTLFNLQGQQVGETQDHTGDATVNYSGYATGIYFLKIVSEKSVHIVRVIKK